MKKTWVYDLEVFELIFTATFIDKDSDEERVFVVSKNKDDKDAFFEFLANEVIALIGYNCLHYDSQIIEWFLKHKTATTQELRAYSNIVINSKDRRPEFPEWKLSISHLDLFRALSLSTSAKRTGLKWTEFMMDMANIEDMPDELNEHLVLLYNRNDVIATKLLYQKYYYEIELRKALTLSEGVNLMNSTEPDIGKKMFRKYLSEAMKIPENELQQMQTIRDIVHIKDIIFPYVKFETEHFNLVLNEFKKLSLTEDEKFEFTLPCQGINIEYGLGGIHAAPNNKIIVEDDEYMIVTVDATSYYPHLAFQNDLAPAHLPKDKFLELYKGFYLKRKEIPKIDPKNYILKIILNSSYGGMNDKFSFLRDRLVALSICVNGQLLLSMLTEKILLELPDTKLVMMNTDGCEYLLKRKDYDKYLEICKWWETLTTIPLEHDTYTKMVVSDVNNYLAINSKGKTKTKGKFEFENIPLHKNKSHAIIPRAIYEYFVNDIPVEKTIKEHTNIFDFCAGVKAGSSPEKGKSKFVLYQVINQVLERKKLSKIVRYFVSKKGGYLIKEYEDNTTAQVEAPLMNGRRLIKEWKITYFNNSYQIPIEEYGIDWSYYIYKAKEIINAIENKEQLKLL